MGGEVGFHGCLSKISRYKGRRNNFRPFDVTEKKEKSIHRILISESDFIVT